MYLGGTTWHLAPSLPALNTQSPPSVGILHLDPWIPPTTWLSYQTYLTYLTTTLLHINDTARQKVVDGAGAFVEAPSTA